MRYFFKSRRFKIAATLIAALVVLSVIARVAGGIMPPHSSIFGSVLAPIQTAVSKASGFISDFQSKINAGEDLARENAELKQKVNELTSSLIDYDAAIEQNEFLKRYLDIKDNHTDYQFESAMLIARDSDDPFNSFTVNKGSLHGVSAYDPVISETGLIGYISQVGTSSSKVTTILSSDISVAAFDRRTGDAGVVAGTLSDAGAGKTRLSNLSRSCSIAIGDYIVTSGGGVFPEGMLIGTVDEIDSDYNSSIFAQIKPAVDFSSLRDMMIITYFSGQSNLGGDEK